MDCSPPGSSVHVILFYFIIIIIFCPWNFIGKNTGVGCHFLLQIMKENITEKNSDFAEVMQVNKNSRISL